MAKVKSLRVASDKSITHRAVMLSSIAKGSVKINNPLYSDDTMRTIRAMQSLGVNVEVLSSGLVVHGIGKGNLKEPKNILDLGNSATAMRLLSGLIGGEGIFAVLTGDSSLRGRPMMRIIEPLSKMGVNFLYRNGGYAPLAVKGGNIKGINYTSRIASAQVKSAILLAGLYTDEDVVVTEPFKSRNHTENMLKSFGVDVNVEDNKVSLGKNRDLAGNFEIYVPADISSAAFFMVYGALVSKNGIILHDVLLNPTRSGILDVFNEAGVNYEVINERVENFELIGDVKVYKTKKLRPFSVDKDLVPRLVDEIPIISILAIFCDGTSSIRGAGDLRKKESDRIKAICENLNRIGVAVEEFEDGFDIHGLPNPNIKPAKIETFNDHRIAMSFLVLQAATGVNLELSETHSIVTSYPNFIEHLSYLSS